VKRRFRVPHSDPEQEELVQALSLDSDFMLPALVSKFEETGNPRYAWYAVDMSYAGKWVMTD
jgi:hypothetical protein